MKCPHCGYWNKAAFPRCFQCGEPLSRAPRTPEWSHDLKDNAPETQYIRYDDISTQDDPPTVLQSEQTQLVDEIDDLNARRRRGSKYLNTMRSRAQEAQEALQNAPVIRPMPERDDYVRMEDRPPIEPLEDRQQKKVDQYINTMRGNVVAKPNNEEGEQADDPYMEDNNPYIQPRYIFDDEDDSAPILYDGYEQVQTESELGPYTDYAVPRIEGSYSSQSYSMFQNGEYAKNYIPRKKRKLMPRILTWLTIFLVVIAGTYWGITAYIEKSGNAIKESIASQTIIAEREVEGLPGHQVTISGREGAQIYVRELQSSYIITGGVASIEIPDYFWYESLENFTDETMDVTLTPFIKYSEGEQLALEPISYTIDVPLSNVALVNPVSMYQTVNSSIYEIKLNVEKGSTVIIDGNDLSSMITPSGNVSKNVQVLPIGENVYQVSVRSKYHREHNMEIVLNRELQEIPLEISGDTLEESTSEEASSKLFGTTMPGATITILSKHSDLDTSTTAIDGNFSFTAHYTVIGDNVITIQASYPGKADSQITQTIYWMPEADIYTKKAWALSSADYTDLINNIDIRKGQSYVCKGTITRIISETPQLAIMNTSEIEGGEQLVLLENSTKTTWEVGTYYRVFGDAYGLYDTMPRITGRYTYTY